MLQCKINQLNKNVSRNHEMILINTQENTNEIHIRKNDLYHGTFIRNVSW